MIPPPVPDAYVNRPWFYPGASINPPPIVVKALRSKACDAVSDRCMRAFWHASNVACWPHRFTAQTMMHSACHYRNSAGTYDRAYWYRTRLILFRNAGVQIPWGVR